MSCGEVREFLLQADWHADQRRQAAEFLRHFEQCGACQTALQDYDEIRFTLSPAEPSEPEGGWDAMQSRVADSIAGSIPRRQSLWLRPTLAIAASILVVCAVFEVGRQTAAPSRKTVTVSKQLPVEPAISAGEISDKLEAFREVTQVYEGRAGWMMVSENSSAVGLDMAPVTSAKKVLVLRLQLWQGQDLASNAVLLVRAGKKAELNLPLSSGRSLHYRIDTSTDEPERLTLWLELKTPHGGEPLAALSTDLQLEAGQKLAGGKLTTSAGEYDLKVDFAGSHLADDKL